MDKRHGVNFERVIAVFLVVIMITTPITTPLLAQEEADPILQAQLDAEKDVNAAMWFGIGFCIGGIGILIGYAVVPSPPATRLIGKPPEYVAIYTDAYKAKARSIQTRYALYGCLTGQVVGCVSYFLLIAASTPPAESY